MPLSWHNVFQTVQGWVVIGALLLALVTLGLAVAAFVTARRTKWLSEETKGIAQETERLADLQRKALQAATNPILMPKPGIEIVVGHDTITLHACNVGSGLALIQSTRMMRREDGKAVPYGGTVSVAVVPPKAYVSAKFDFSGQTAQLDKYMLGFWIEIDYTDSVAEQAETALFHVEDMPNADVWRVIQIELRRVGDEEPYASSGWDAIH